MAADPSTRDAIDDVFYDGMSDLDDAFNDRPKITDTRDDKPILSPRPIKRKAGIDDDAFGLGLDEEVKIAKKRKPIAKLDEARLLSEPGIPKLRTLIRSKQISRKLRLKGKGHEFNDAAKLLNYYQLWLDDLYPRAKFADALQMVEKAGHTKRMQMTRCEWINESKPGYLPAETHDLEQVTEDPDLFASATDNPKGQNTTTRSDEDVEPDSLFIPDLNFAREDDRHQDPDDDELDALLAEENNTTIIKPSTRTIQRHDDSEGEDDLDALLAEQDTRQRLSSTRTNHNQSKQNLPDEEEYDDLDALLAEQETTRAPHESSTIADKEKADHEDIDPPSKSNTEAHAHDDENIQLPSSWPAGEQASKGTDTEAAPEELVEEDFLSSSPLPNDDIYEDHVLNEPDDSAIRATEGPQHDVDEERSDEAAIHDDVEPAEIEEDFISSSPIDLSQ